MKYKGVSKIEIDCSATDSEVIAVVTEEFDGICVGLISQWDSYNDEESEELLTAIKSACDEAIVKLHNPDY